MLLRQFLLFSALSVSLVLNASRTAVAQSRAMIGSTKSVGFRENPTKQTRLIIDKAGTYENYLIDGEWNQGNLVKIRANDVILRNSEIRFGRGNGIFVSGEDVLIESCRIHHCLSGSFFRQDDAHGITGNPKNLTIRNCEIYYVSGDAVQFDPDRNPWDNVIIENCTFWTGPLPHAAGEFLKGDRPGENAVDTKQSGKNPISRITIRRCLFYGWGDGQIDDQAALNLKEHISATVQNCVFRDNDICFRLRGFKPASNIEISDCAVYRSDFAVRLEDNIRDVIIRRLAVGDEIGKLFQLAKMKKGRYTNLDQTEAPDFEIAVKEGLVESESLPSYIKEEPANEQGSSMYGPSSFNIRAYLPGGSIRVALAFLLVLLIPIIGFTAYIGFTGRKEMFGKVVEETLRRLFSR